VRRASARGMGILAHVICVTGLRPVVMGRMPMPRPNTRNEKRETRNSKGGETRAPARYNHPFRLKYMYGRIADATMSTSAKG
jgi:hypothetical protein